MLIPFKRAFRILAIATAVLTVPPAAFAQQQGPGAVLPPPSLYDDAPPATNPAAAPAQPAAAPKAEPAPAAAEQPAPAAAAAESKPMTAAPAPSNGGAKEPWYKRLWPFGGNGKKNGQEAQAQPSAAAPTAGGTSPEAGTVSDSPGPGVRTGMLGECVKMGRDGGCPGAKLAAPEPTPVAAAAPPAPRVSEPQPVEVKPLSPEAVQEPRATEPSAVPPPVTAAPEPPSPPAPTPMTQTTTLAADALFDYGSAELKPAAKAKLDQLAVQLDQFNYQHILITGHTDPTGSSGVNEKLSLLRAESVKRYLVSKGLSADKIEAEGMGSSMPMVTDKDCSKLKGSRKIACYQLDRRVEIEVSGVTLANK